MESTKLIQKYKFLYLLISLLIFFILNAFIANDTIGRYVFNSLFSIMFLFAIYSIAYDKRIIITAIILGFFSLLGHWLSSTIFPGKELYLIDSIAIILFIALIITATLTYIIRDKEVSFNSLCGAVCAYLLIGLLWTFIYAILFIVHPNAFSISTELLKQHIGNTSQHFVYYSFVTLSTLGYGDITPLSNPAKTFAWLEAIIGQVYLTIWIAHLVGMYIKRKQ
ncbi:MAG: two pore domain potassium channel family protein [Gammaproteobacteria bacterium]|nr:two pore domain potassium channel family protein [Gammaproteobacteria bacterium]